MATIYTQFNIIDNMSSPLYNMASAGNQVVATMGQIDTATEQGFDSAAIDDARNSVEMVNVSLDETQMALMANTAEMEQFNQTATSGHSILKKLGTLAAAVGLGLVISTAASFMYDSATALEATEAKFETVFAGYEDVAQGIVDDFQILTPASESATRSMVSGIQDLLVPMGFARDVATEMTGETMTLVGALTNFNSATHGATDVASAFQSALTGEYTSLKALGIQVDATTIQEKVLAMGLADTTDEITSQMEAQALLELAYEQSGDALAAYNEESLDTLTLMGLLQAGFADTFGEAGQSLLPKINDFIILVNANMATLSAMIYGFSDALGVVLNVAGVAFTVLMSIASLMVDSWSILEPLILGVAVALGLYNAALAANLLLTKGWVVAQTSLTAVQTFLSIGFGVLAGNTAAASAAMFTYNSELLACPLTWIVLAVVAVVAVFYAAVAAVNHFAGTSYDATGLICGAFAVAGAFIGNVLFGVFNTLTGIGIESYNLVATFANFFANVFDDPVGAIISLFSGLFDFILGIVQSAASLIDTVLKTDMSGAVESFRNDMADGTAEIVGEQTVVMEKMTASDHQLSGFDYGSAWNTGYNFGAGTSIYDDGSVETYDDDITDTLADIASDTSDISDSLSATVEELAYLRDLAEVEAVNKYTTAEIKVDMGGITNNVSGTADVDGIIDYLVTGVSEAMTSSAKGVHV